MQLARRKRVFCEFWPAVAVLVECRRIDDGCVRIDDRGLMGMGALMRCSICLGSGKAEIGMSKAGSPPSLTLRQAARGEGISIWQAPSEF